MNLAGFHWVLRESFQWAWRASLAAAILAALVCIVTILTSRWLSPRGRQLLWCLVLLRFLWPAAPPSPLSLSNLWRIPAPTAMSSSSVAPIEDATPAEPLAAVPEHRVLIGSSFSGPAPTIRPDAPSAASWLPYLWLGGWLLVVGRVVWTHLRLQAAVRIEPRLNDSRVLKVLGNAKRELGIRARLPLLETRRLATPAVFGLIKPRLLLPIGLAGELSNDELRLLFLHELSHLKRRDVLFNWAIVLVQGCHWFNPAAWWAMKRLRLAREIACDFAVLERLASNARDEYGRLLIKLVTLCSSAPRFTPALTPILNPQPQIQRRIIMISRFKPASPAAAGVAILLVLVLGTATFTRSAETKETPSADRAGKPVISNASPPQNLEVLQKHLAMLDDLIEKKQGELRAIKNIAPGIGTTGALTAVKRLEDLRMEATAEYIAAKALSEKLKSLPLEQARYAVHTIQPDQVLTNLSDRLNEIEQQLASLRVEFGNENPEVKKVEALQKVIKRQIDERIVGIITGFRIRMEQSKAKLDALAQQLDEANKSARRRESLESSYRRQSHDLELLSQVRDQLKMRILQEQIEQDLSRAAQGPEKDEKLSH